MDKQNLINSIAIALRISSFTGVNKETVNLDAERILNYICYATANKNFNGIEKEATDKVIAVPGKEPIVNTKLYNEHVRLIEWHIAYIGRAITDGFINSYSELVAYIRKMWDMSYSTCPF